MKLRTVCVAVGFALLQGVVSAPLLADQLITSNVTAPLSIVVQSGTCTTPQAIALSGQLHMSFSITTNNNATHIHSHANSQNISGIGLIDGSRYTLVIVNNGEFNFNGVPPLELQSSSDSDLISQGSTPNLHVRLISHMTVNANGDVTVEFLKGSIVCK
jgi:hypothetical protein